MFAEENSQKPPYPTFAEVVEEAKRMGDIGFPIAAMSLVGYLKNMILVAYMGRLGSLELAGGSLAIGFTNITGYSVLSGLAMGMEPLCTQASGSRNLPLLTLTLHRTILLLLLASLPISFLWLHLHSLLLSLHQDPHITRIAALYCRYAIPDLLATTFLHPIRIYLRSTGSTWPLLWSSSLALLFHIPILTLFTFTFQLGVPGIAISSFLTNFNTLFFLLIYVYFNFGTDLHHHHRRTSSSEKYEWGMLIRFSLQSCVGVCLEWWWYEMMTILAGYLHNPRVAIATSGIIIQTTSLLYTVPSALSASSSTRVGNELGRGDARGARVSTVVAVGMAVVGSGVGVGWTTVGRERWGRVFSSDREVVEMSMAVLPIIGMCEIGNCPQTTACGVLRGSARPGVGAGINLCAFYLVGAPVGVVLAFGWELGLVGLCYGLLAAQMACVVSLLLVLFNTDWEKESAKAKSLVGMGSNNNNNNNNNVINNMNDNDNVGLCDCEALL